MCRSGTHSDDSSAQSCCPTTSCSAHQDDKYRLCQPRGRNAGQATDSPNTSDPSILQDLLAKQLGPEYLSTRPGAGGCKLTYIEGWRVIALANEIFGFDGWSSETKSIEVDFVDTLPDGRFSVGVSATVKVWLKNGSSHEDVGYGKLENSRSKADALDKCRKEAVTDALKRTLRVFGNLMGNCLYDKVFLNNIKNMQAQKEKFLPSKLYRPEHVGGGSSSKETKSSNNEVTEPIHKEPTTTSTVPRQVAPQYAKPAPANVVAYKTESLAKRPDTFPPPPPKISMPDKRKMVKESAGRDSKRPNESIAPLAPTLSDTYFDLDEDDLAQLDNVEASEIHGQGLGETTFSEESGIITDTSVQISQEGTLLLRGPDVRVDLRNAAKGANQNTSGSASRILDKSMTIPNKSTNQPTSMRSNTTLHNKLGPSKQSYNPIQAKQTSTVIQAGHLPNIRGGVAMGMANQSGARNQTATGALEADGRARADSMGYAKLPAHAVDSSKTHAQVPMRAHTSSVSTSASYAQKATTRHLAAEVNLGIRRPLSEMENNHTFAGNDVYGNGAHKKMKIGVGG